ncbi:MAG: hypothetical protein ACHWZW_03115 [Spirulina sp.]
MRRISRLFWVTALTVFLGGIVTSTIVRRIVIAYYLGRQFDLLDVYQAGSLIAITGCLVAWLILWRWVGTQLQGWINAEVALFLYRQTGRRDLSDDQRAAIAYVLQDLREGQ